MKKIAVITILIALCFNTFSQNDSIQTKKSKKAIKATKSATTTANKPVLFKDRIVLDFMSSYWFGMNTESTKQFFVYSPTASDPIKAKNMNFGFNGAIIFDIPIKRNSPFSFGLGLGVSNYNLYSNGIFGIGQNYTTIMSPIPNYIDTIRKNKLSYTNLHIPIEFRFRHKSGFKLAVGVRVGVTVDLHSKYFGPALNGSQDKDLFKDYKIVNRTKIPVEVTFRTGWKFVGISASYMLTKLFESGKGPQICPFSVGISLSPY